MLLCAAVACVQAVRNKIIFFKKILNNIFGKPGQGWRPLEEDYGHGCGEDRQRQGPGPLRQGGRRDQHGRRSGHHQDAEEGRL